MRSRGRSTLLAFVAVSFLAARPAAAYDFSLGLRTIGQGYQVRRFAADGSNELLSRRRLTQYMDLAVFDLSPLGWRGVAVPPATIGSPVTADPRGGTSLAAVVRGLTGQDTAAQVYRSTVLAFFLIYGFGEGSSIPTVQDLVASRAPEASRGAVVALWVGAARAGQTVGPLLAAVSLSSFGASATFLAGAGIMVVLFIVQMVGRRVIDFAT